MRKVMLAVLVATMLGACAFQMAFRTPGATPEQAQQDASACNFEVTSRDQSGLTAIPALMREEIALCMKGKGYTTVQQ